MENIKREESRETSGSRQRATLSSYNTLRCTTYTIIKYKNFSSSSSSLSPSLSLSPRSFGRCIEKVSRPESVEGDHPLLLWGTTRGGRWERDGESISLFNVTPMGIAFRYNYPLFRRQLYLARGPFHSFHPEETPLALLARFLGRVRTFLSLFSFRFSLGRPSCVHYTHSYAFSRTDNGAPNFFFPLPFLTALFSRLVRF